MAVCETLDHDHDRDEEPEPNPHTPPVNLLRSLYSVEQAAEILSVSRTTLYAWFRTGIIPGIKIEGRRFVAARDIESFIEARRTDAINEYRADIA